MGDFELNLLEPAWAVFLVFLQVVAVTAIVLIALLLPASNIFLTHFFLTLPLRRAERARLFLDLLDATIKQGRSVEETIISRAQSRDVSMGMKFHIFSAWLEQGAAFDEALDRVPHFLPPQVSAMLRAGRQMGDLTKVLPACGHLLQDATSQVRGALNYVVLMMVVTLPVSCYILALLAIFVIPKFMEVFAGLGVTSGTGLMEFLSTHMWSLIGFQTLILVLLWLVAIIYIGGPRMVAWFPVLEPFHYYLPWRRRRMQRDFSTMLALLLDSGVPEAPALTLAADCSANSVFRRRANRAVEALRQGVKLPEAVQQLDDAGEFRWRLRNAAAGPGGFLRALAGWHESLDARAFQQEQAAAHVITTSLVLWSGLFVGLVLVAVFSVLTSLINVATLW
jgi:type II secretory pathway component PulF